MKTFLGFATGLLAGFVAGVGVLALTLADDKDAREYIEKKANEFNQE